MSLQRGSYGVVLDNHQNSHAPWIWGALLLLSLLLLWLVLGRGCRSTPDEQQLEGGITIPEVEVERERPSLLRHLLRRPAQETTAQPDTIGPELVPTTQRTTERGWGRRAPSTVSEKQVELPAEVTSRINQAHQALAESRLLEARNLYRKLLTESTAQPVRPVLERALGDLNRRILFEDTNAPEKTRHLVVRGDLISRLAARYGCTQEYLLQANQLERPEALRLGQEIQVLNQPRFELTITRSNRSAYLTLNGLFFKRYTFVSSSVEALSRDATSFTLRERRARSDSNSSAPSPSLILLSVTDDKDTLPCVLSGSWGAPQRVQGLDTTSLIFNDNDIRELHTLLPSSTVVTVLE